MTARLVTRRHNKDGSISITCQGCKVHEVATTDLLMISPLEASDAFLKGWFGSEDRSQWKLRQTFK